VSPDSPIDLPHPEWLFKVNRDESGKQEMGSEKEEGKINPCL